MGYRELGEKYGGNFRERVNRAIRAECPGGDAALDRLTTWHHICQRLGWDAQPEPVHVTAYRHLLEIVDAMELEIRRRYDLPPKQPTEDLER